MKHDAGVVGEAPLLLVGVLSHVRVVAGHHAAPTADPKRVSFVATRSRVMVLSEYLRYILAGYRPNRRPFLHD